ncbi:ferritin-like domain-containing protein [Gracilibacillus salinarum]|uniref:Ferritin-like domain-containing protein n=1 Tax=Gracilibacillus salinarum TaxID=2932255 RepID=A0ABY4GIX1_9BACI|nr:ferritin-like domain-containing protein [Gracilibacillus salinarum]UOQ84120.1 ferritin-like domain-containing protein [Gracilibacillus salinarum]
MYQYLNYENYRVMNNNKFNADLQKAINAEYSAISCYGMLAKMAPNSTQINRILEIQNDEKRHLQSFAEIYIRLTGQQPTYNITEECPTNYRDGIEFAFNDEQGAVDFYLDMADRAQEEKIKQSFQRAAADEQNHAVWFLYFINK